MLKILGPAKNAQRLAASVIAISIAACPMSMAAGKVSDKITSGKSAKHNSLIAQAPKAAPVEIASPALISVLKDITKSLSESSDYNNLSDPKQKAVVGIAISVLQTALANPQLSFNRIITTDDKSKAENSMSAEIWDSGEVVVRQSSDPQAAVCHAAASCLWAKKLNGLVNISIAGNSNEVIDGQKLGEFIFVASGRSGIESGFDIQSQSSVSYWIGKLTQFVADSAGSPSSQISPASDTTSAASAVTTAPVAEETSTEKVVTPATQEPKVEDHSDSPKTEGPKAEIPASTAAIASKAENYTEKSEQPEEKAPRRSYLLLKAPSVKKAKTKPEAITKPESKEQATKPVHVKAEVKQPEAKVEAKSQSEEKPVQVSEAPKQEPEVTAVSDEKTATITETSTATIETPVKELQPKQIEPQVAIGPSPDALLVTPDKAQAGQLITVSVVNARLIPETGVDVDFNGTVLTTGANGQVQFLVPEDSTPGPTLKVAIAGRQLATIKVVHILQPLSTPSEAQPPHVDRVTANASKFDTVTILGHNFNGQAGAISVTIDGKWDAQILSTSPLELKILVPEEVPAGQHSVSVTNAGLRSNAALFNLISLQVAPDARPGQVPTKLIVRALGTLKPVAVHLRNNTPNIITIVKGNDLRIKTPGGKDNSIAVSVRLKQRGNYNIEASIE